MDEMKTAEDAPDDSQNVEQNKHQGKCWRDQIDEKWLNDKEMAGLSKNQQKKFLKKKLFQETRLDRRKLERKRKKERRAELQEAGMPLPKRLKRKDMIGVQYSDIKVAIDLDYYDLMNDNDLRMVVKQVKHCYSDNRKFHNPIQLHVTSFCGKFKDLFLSLQPGCANWDIVKSEKNFMETFPDQKIVYLTAESNNVLKKIDSDVVYIIGGLVDHNQHKGLCHKLAVEKNISHAQLPISEYITLNTRKVLTINHVFEILLRFKESQDWRDAFFKVIPRRKGIDKIDEKGGQLSVTKELSVSEASKDFKETEELTASEALEGYRGTEKLAAPKESSTHSGQDESINAPE